MAHTTRERILLAALELSAERGIEGMSLQQLADDVGLHKSSLFHHFSSKEELTREVYDGVAERLLKRLEPFLSEDPPRLESILAASDALVDHFAAERPAARLFMRQMVSAQNPAPPVGEPGSDTVYRVLEMLGAWLARARAAGVIRHVRVRHTLLNLMGVVLFYPAVVHDIGEAAFGADPWSPEILEGRKRELRGFLRGALEPS